MRIFGSTAQAARCFGEPPVIFTFVPALAVTHRLGGVDVDLSISPRHERDPVVIRNVTFDGAMGVLVDRVQPFLGLLVELRLEQEGEALTADIVSREKPIGVHVPRRKVVGIRDDLREQGGLFVRVDRVIGLDDLDLVAIEVPCIRRRPASSELAVLLRAGSPTGELRPCMRDRQVVRIGCVLSLLGGRVARDDLVPWPIGISTTA